MTHKQPEVHATVGFKHLCCQKEMCLVTCDTQTADGFDKVWAPTQNLQVDHQLWRLKCLRTWYFFTDFSPTFAWNNWILLFLFATTPRCVLRLKTLTRARTPICRSTAATTFSFFIYFVFIFNICCFALFCMLLYSIQAGLWTAYGYDLHK